MRGLLIGVFSGTALGGLLMVMAAIVLPEVSLTGPEPEATTEGPEATPGLEAGGAGPTVPGPGAPPVAGSSPELVPVSEDTPPDMDTAAVDVPVSGSAETGIGAPGETPVPTAPDPELGGPPDPGGSGLTERPAAPGLDPMPEPVPEPVVGDETPAPVPPGQGSEPIAPGAEGDVDTVALGTRPVEPVPDQEPERAVAPPAVTPSDEPEIVVSDDTDAGSDEPSLGTDGEVEPAVISARPEEPEPDTTPEPEPEIASPPPAFDRSGTAVRPGGVPVSTGATTIPPALVLDTPGLPGRGSSLIPAEPEPEAEAEPDAEPVSRPDGPAIETFAAPFTRATDRPVFGIVLVDTPAAADLTLTDLPFPVAVIVDPLAPGAVARTAALRSAGVEVLVLTPIPDGASPTDLAVAFEAFLNAVPEAVAFIDVAEARLQDSRPLATQVINLAAETGHGVLTYEKGLNSLLRVAEAETVPAMVVTRVFDDGGSDIRQMKRLLDQGAFDAGRQGRAIVQGVLREDVLAMLAAWSTGSRADSVEFAPVSAVLTAP